MLSLLSVSNSPETCLRHRCSSWYLRISPLHQEFQSPLQHSSYARIACTPEVKPRNFTDDATNHLRALYAQ